MIPKSGCRFSEKIMRQAIPAILEQAGPGDVLVMHSTTPKVAGGGPEEESMQNAQLLSTVAAMLLLTVGAASAQDMKKDEAVSYTHLRAHETRHDLVCRLL